jgi:hypothetical protein
MWKISQIDCGFTIDGRSPQASHFNDGAEMLDRDMIVRRFNRDWTYLAERGKDAESDRQQRE